VKRKYILFAAIMILIIFSLFMTHLKYNILERSQFGELNFTVTPEKTRIQEGEVFQIHLTLTNVGENTINVWRMYEQVSYDIFFFNLDGSMVPYECGVLSRLPLTDEDLVELSLGESINSTFDSTCWNLEKGEYTLSAIYDTTSSPYEDIKKPHWIGRIISNNVTVIVE